MLSFAFDVGNVGYYR